MKTLYIIGNGFDRKHGLPTSYFDFSRYCAEQHKELYEQINHCLVDLNDNWSNFENALGRQKIYELIKSIKSNIKCNRDYPIGIDYSELDYAFRSWIVEINNFIVYQNILKEIPSVLSFSEHDFYLSFNYTLTLETLYQIPNHKILHIHGYEKVCDFESKDEKPFSKLIYGHDRHKNDLESEYSLEDCLKHELIDAIMGFRKDYQDKKLNSWIAEIPEIERIVVLGHSMDTVDNIYFNILSTKYANANWEVGFHDIENEITDFVNKTKRCQALMIKKYSLFKF